ncbi:MAG: glycosyltransferase family 2 protein, partial [Patescibacteria group bacterium]
ISIIIVHFFGVNYIIDCLNSVFNSDYLELEVVVVFNGNKDGSYEIVREKFSQVICVFNKKNLGFSKANNQGIKKSTGDIVFLLNDDTVIHRELISILSKELTISEAIGIVGPKIYYYNSKKIWFAGGKIDWERQKTYHIGVDVKDGKLKNDKKRKVDFITGCALMIKKEVINKIGLLDEKFFAFYEDADWCQKTKKERYEVIYIPFGGVWHHKSATAGNIFFGKEKEKNLLWLIFNYFWRDLKKEFRRYKNKFIFFNRHLPNRLKLLFFMKFIFILTPILFWNIIYNIPKSILNLGFKKLN